MFIVIYFFFVDCTRLFNLCRKIDLEFFSLRGYIATTIFICYTTLLTLLLLLFFFYWNGHWYIDLNNNTSLYILLLSFIVKYTTKYIINRYKEISTKYRCLIYINHRWHNTLMRKESLKYSKSKISRSMID